MKETKRRTEITIETRNLRIIRMRSGKTESAFCENCQRDVRYFTEKQAILVFGVSSTLLESLAQGNQIHTVGENAVCADSLAEYFKHEIRFVED